MKDVRYCDILNAKLLDDLTCLLWVYNLFLRVSCV